MSRVIFLTGAPEAKNLEWDNDSLSATLLPPFRTEHTTPNPKANSTGYSGPVWRKVSLEQAYFPTGLTPDWQVDAPGHANLYRHKSDHGEEEETSFLDLTKHSFATRSDGTENTESFSLLQEDESEFYEKSLLVHEEMPSSQILGPDVQSPKVTSSISGASSSYGESPQFPLTTSPLAALPVMGRLSDLQDIPNARLLDSINPQTMTVNAVIGIISMPSPKTIKTRMGHDLELVEMIVGDDTRAGFGINLWLPAFESRQPSLLKTMASKLRPRDIVLARNVALSTFKGNVYGQSLRRDMTKLELLYRVQVDKEDDRGLFRAKEIDVLAEENVQMAKVKRVRDWVMDFVGYSREGNHRNRGGGGDQEKVAATTRQWLPPDTQ